MAKALGTNVNTVSLKLAHITGASADPPAGTIDRDPHGNPTGVLKENFG